MYAQGAAEQTMKFGEAVLSKRKFIQTFILLYLNLISK